MNTYVVVTAIIKYEDKFLIARRDEKKEFAPGKWEFISGFVEERVPCEEVLKEELSEEIDLKNYKIQKSFNPIKAKDGGDAWVIVPYLVEAFDINNIKAKPNEHSALKWVLKKELEDYPDLLGLKDLIRSGAFG